MPLLAVHGLPETKRVFWKVIEPLAAAGFEVIVPDLRGFDEVVLLEYPWSTALIDAAVGHASVPRGPRSVAVMHSPGTVDDRLAVHAARRRELSPTDDPHQPPDQGELEHLLSPRW